MAFTGCIGGDSPDDVNATRVAAAAPSVPWEGALDANVTTPGHVVFASDADRRADVVAPGAPQFAALDELMANFVEQKGLQAAGVAVLRNGELRYENGYGWMDEARSIPTPPDPMFRVASVTKPMTAALIQLMAAEGRVSLDDPLFCIGPEPRPGCQLRIPVHPARPVQDERVADITLEDTIRHRTGWVRADCSMGSSEELQVIAADLGITAPPPAWRKAQWLLGTPMRFDPGSNPNEGNGPQDERLDTYCNMGYTSLALVAEQHFAAPIQAIMEAYLFRPLEVTGDIEQGRSLPEDRNPREPHYPCEYTTESAVEPGKEVCAPDGGLDMESLIGSGGLIATAASVGAVYHEFWNDGTLRDDFVYGQQCHMGGMPSTATTACRYTQTEGANVPGMVEVVVLASGQIGHETPLPDAVVTYEFEGLHADLLSAYVAAEQELGPPILT